MKKIIIICSVIFLFSCSLLGQQEPGGDKISLKLKGVPLVEVLNMIAMQYNLNLVVSGNVTGEVTIHLEDVDIFTALNAILNANGYNYFVKDEVVVVKPRDITVEGEYQSRLFTLKYINPETARKALEPRLSEKGQIIILDRNNDNVQGSSNFQPNRILITERLAQLKELAQVIEEIDIQERLIQIEAKIIETTVDNSSKLGFLWPSSVTTTLGNAEGWASTGSTTTTTEDFDSKAGIYDIENESWNWGKLSVQQLNLVLDLLKQNGNSKLISDPHITTLENHEAEIKIETVIPIQTINRFSEGAVIQDIVTFQDEEVGITLKVTPRINVPGQITLEVNPTIEDIIGYTGTENNRKPITTARSIKTRITVNDGESIALGGLLKEDEIQTEQRVPVLGYIPILGKLLFTHKSTEKSTTDLIILITPRIIK